MSQPYHICLTFANSNILAFYGLLPRFDFLPSSLAPGSAKTIIRVLLSVLILEHIEQKPSFVLSRTKDKIKAK